MIIAGSYFSQDPDCQLNNKISWWVFIKEFFHFSNNLLSKFFFFIVAFNNQTQKVVENFIIQIFATKFKENFHCLQIPLMSWRKSLAKLSDFEDKCVSKVLICGTMKSLHHFTYNNFNVFIGCHSVKQF